MGIFSYVKAGKKIFDTIKSVKPAVGKSKLQKAVDSAKLEGRKLKGKTKKFIQKMEQDIDPARIKLRQTTQKLKGEKVTESGISKGKDLRENKMGGGMMGRRMGYSQGSKKGKIPTTPKEKSLAKLAPPRDRITFGDVVAGRTKGKRMQARYGSENPMIKEDSMRDRMKQPLKTKRSKELMLEDLKKSKFKKRKP